MKASILTIGDEILNGSILDTNATFIADQSIKEGIEIITMLSVADKKEEINDALTFLSKKSDIILITGGLGPTKDDITIKTLADFLNVPLEFNNEIYTRITNLLLERNITTINVTKENCSFPKGARLLNNKKGTAPCLWLKKENTTIISMPGVPLEMKQIFVEEVLPKIKKDFKTKSIINKYIMTAGIWESEISKKIQAIEENLPQNISIAYLPSLGQVKLRITGNNTNEIAINEIVKDISEKISEHIYSYNEKDNLAKIVGELLIKKNKTLSTAESCTGGKIAHKTTSNAGSSAYFEGSIISYSNEIKMMKLGVKKSTLEKHGAVSQQTVIEMANGALKAMSTDYSIAVSGIAGPTGGTEEKPVGTVWIAVANNDSIETKKFQFWPFREENIELSSIAALNMLRKFILKQ